MNPPVALERWSYKHSLLVGKTLGRLRASQKGGDTSLIAPGRFEELLAEGTQSFRNDLTSLFAVTKAHGLDIIVPTVSYAWERADPATTHRWQRALPSIEPGDVPRLYSAYNEVIREVASQFDYPVVETREFGLELLDLYADGDPIHFNDEGADVMAHGLAAAISERLGYRGLSDFGLLTRSDHEPTPRSNSSTGSDHPQ